VRAGEPVVLTALEGMARPTTFWTTYTSYSTRGQGCRQPGTAILRGRVPAVPQQLIDRIGNQRTQPLVAQPHLLGRWLIAQRLPQV